MKAALQTNHDHVKQEAFDIQHPSIKLINMIGGGFFNEPRYYYSNETNFEAFSRSIRESGTVHPITLKSLGLTEQACQVIQAAVDVANSDSPEDLLIIAYWARDFSKGLKMRTTPQILLAIAAAHPNTKPFVRKYTPHITQRADDITQVFGAFRSLFQPVKNSNGKITHKGTLPHSLRKGLADAIRQTPAYSLIKYKNQKPSFKDVLAMIGGSKRVQNAVSPGMYDYLVKGEVTERAPEVLKVREAFNKVPSTPEALQALEVSVLSKGGITWENLVSKFGSTKEAWEKSIPLMGETALLRNLRNFEEAGISSAAWSQVLTKLVKHSENSSQLPYQYFIAAKYAGSHEAKKLIGLALNRVCKNIPDLSGVTLVLSDNSGSAANAKISEKSDTTVSNCGNTLMATIAKRLGKNKAILGVFGDRYRQVWFDDDMDCLEIAQRIEHYAKEASMSDGYLGHPRFLNANRPAFKLSPSAGKGVGPGTETGLWYALEDLISRKVSVDRIILMSDVCCYNIGDIRQFNLEMEERFSKYQDGQGRITLSNMVDYYLKNINPNCHVYSLNLSGHNQSQLAPSSKIHLLSGWSERIVNTIQQAEAPRSVRASDVHVATTQEIPTLEAIREEFKVE